MNMLFGLGLSLMSAVGVSVLGLIILYPAYLFQHLPIPATAKKLAVGVGVGVFLISFYSTLRTYSPAIDVMNPRPFYPPTIRDVPKTAPLVEDVDRDGVFDEMLEETLVP